MGNLKHVGWLYRLRGKADTTLVLKNKANNFEQFNTKWQKSDAVYTIPDTHRVVPVELLEKCTEQLLEGAEAHQNLNDEFGNSSRIAPGRIACEALSDELRAIIEDKP